MKYIRKLLFKIIFSKYERMGLCWILKQNQEHVYRLSKTTSDYEQSLRYQEDVMESKRIYEKIYGLLTKEDKKWQL